MSRLTAWLLVVCVAVLFVTAGCATSPKPANHGYEVDLTPDNNGEDWL